MNYVLKFKHQPCGLKIIKPFILQTQAFHKSFLKNKTLYFKYLITSEMVATRCWNSFTHQV